MDESIEGVESNFIRFCPIHKLPHDPDGRIYHGAGRLCPHGGEPLIGSLARFRDRDGNPEMDLPPHWWDL